MNRAAAALLLTSVFAMEIVAATVSIEVVTTGRVQPTAHREWLQLLAGAGATNVRIRSGRGSERPAIDTVDRDSYHVVGVLSGAKLALPGGVFGRRDRARLADYFERLKADGPERQTADTGNFGLTREEFEAVFRDLGGPTLFSTTGLTLNEIVAEAGKTLRFKIAINSAVRRPPRADARKFSDDLSKLTIGATLAIALRRDGLVLIPEKPRGRPIQYRVVPTPTDKDAETWPAGYRPEARPREVAPAIMEFTNVEIDGYKLNEVVDVIAPRLKIPVLWDHATLARHKIDPDQIDVKLPASRSTYKTILRKLLSQARLKGELRVDEAGTAFYWITR